MYEAQLNIYCVDGMVEGIQGSDPKRIHDFLLSRDHEGSSVSMVVRDTPDDWRMVDSPEEVYAEVKAWL